METGDNKAIFATYSNKSFTIEVPASSVEVHWWRVRNGSNTLARLLLINPRNIALLVTGWYATGSHWPVFIALVCIEMTESAEGLANVSHNHLHKRCLRRLPGRPGPIRTRRPSLQLKTETRHTWISLPDIAHRATFIYKVDCRVR